MAGWDWLQTMTELNGGARLAGLVLLAISVVVGMFAYARLRRAWPERVTVGRVRLRIRWIEGFAAALLMLWIAAELVPAGIALQQEIQNAAQDVTGSLGSAGAGNRRRAADAVRLREEEIEALQQRVAEAETRLAGLASAQRRLVDADVQAADLAGVRLRLREAEAGMANLPRLQQRLAEAEARITEFPALQLRLKAAETKVAALEAIQAQKRLSDSEKQKLIAALRPYPGQIVAVASVLGDDDGKALADDMSAVFDAAGWNRGDAPGILPRRWDADPVSVEIVLNAADGRSSRMPAAIAALIAVVRELKLAAGNPVSISRDVPPGQALIKVGRRLRL